MHPIFRSLDVLVSGLLVSGLLWTGTLGATSQNSASNLEPQKDQHSVSAAQKITTFLWFDQNAEQAIEHYASIFKHSKIVSSSRWGDGGPMPKGTLISATFELEGQTFMALNGGPMYRFNEAISLFVSCETQAEVDELWNKLSAGGEPGRCGWLKDKFGLSWQIVPKALGEMLSDPDPARVQRVAAAMMQMNKLDIARLKQAYEQR